MGHRQSSSQQTHPDPPLKHRVGQAEMGCPAPPLGESLAECDVSKRDTSLGDTAEWKPVCLGDKYDNTRFSLAGYNATAETPSRWFKQDTSFSHRTTQAHAIQGWDGASCSQGPRLLPSYCHRPLEHCPYLQEWDGLQPPPHSSSGLTGGGKEGLLAFKGTCPPARTQAL